jgi:cell division protein FtsQ
MVFLPLAMGGTIYWLDSHDFFAIQSVQIEVSNQKVLDSKYLNPKIKEIQQMMEALRGESLLRTNLNKISKTLDTLDWITNYQVTRQIPNRLTLTLTAHEPQVLIQTRNGKLYPVDEQGTVLNSVEPHQAPDTIIAVGENFFSKPELRKKTIDLLNKIPRNGSFSRQNISEIKYDQKDGFWMTMIRSNLQVKMGEEDLDIKATRISQVIDYLEQHQIKARVIDANLSKKVLVRLHKGP